MGFSIRPWMVFLACWGIGSCSGDPRDTQVREAVVLFNEGLDRADGSALWDLADRQTREDFEDLARAIREGLELVEQFWPDEEKAATRRAIGGDFIGRQTDGRALFLSLIDPRQLDAPADSASRRIDRIEWAEDRALVVMRSGDTLEFRQDPDGRWRTSVFLEAWRRHPARETLVRNLQVLRDNARILAEAAPETSKETR